MVIKEYLEQYRVADRKAKRLRREYEKEKALIDSIKSPLATDGTPHGSGISKTVEMRAIKLADKLLEYEDAELDAIEIRQAVFDTIMKIDGIESDILYAYYVDYYDERRNKARTWDDVAEIVHVEPRTVYRIKLRAFKKLSLYVSI
jgi:DNA-directed RNA polymerase specialized sigma subunit